jgi:DNA-binding MarR family transcriptional regulator
MSDLNRIKVVREGLRRFNRRAGVLKSDPYKLGLSLSQSSALIDISRFNELRVYELVDLLHLEKSSVSRLISVLEERRLIKVKDNPSDGRSKILTLTEAGRRAVNQINEISNRSLLELFEKLDAKEQKLIAAAFEKIASAVDQIEEG